eukprot:TRINITY_DN526_c0_g1_i1.p3 TRINITY_DN526_c0_g1~~TRINITY_DN526_c0_g1_i1.p3  ORF type:complete len:140 (-),score=28.58 TRINITY_DN526_c0_g1_i1:760-1179(-)
MSSDRDYKEKQNDGRTLHVASLSERTRQEDLEEHFRSVAKVEKCFLVTDPNTRESRRFAFITMETAEDAEKAIEKLHDTELDGHRISVDKVKKRAISNHTKYPTQHQHQLCTNSINNNHIILQSLSSLSTYCPASKSPC